MTHPVRTLAALAFLATLATGAAAQGGRARSQTGSASSMKRMPKWSAR